jgi:hypothetical protein
VDMNPRDARLDDTSSAAPVKLTVRPQRFAGPGALLAPRMGHRQRPVRARSRVRAQGPAAGR